MKNYRDQPYDSVLLQPSKDCNMCDWHNDYTCFECEHEQIREEI